MHDHKSLNWQANWPKSQVQTGFWNKRRLDQRLQVGGTPAPSEAP